MYMEDFVRGRSPLAIPPRKHGAPNLFSASASLEAYLCRLKCENVVKVVRRKRVCVCVCVCGGGGGARQRTQDHESRLENRLQ
jgi:hypothetical protein